MYTSKPRSEVSTTEMRVVALAVLFCLFHSASSTVLAQPTISSAGSLIGTLGLSATVTTSFLTSAVQKLQSDLKVCEKLLEYKKTQNDCSEETENCTAELMKCSIARQDLQDVADRDEDLTLIDKICDRRIRLCTCLRIVDENECNNQGSCSFDAGRQSCLPS